MRQIANSFLPFTLLLIGIVIAVVYSEHMAAEKSRAYNTKEINLIMGKQSHELDKLLGEAAYSEVIHRDNMVVARQG